MWSYLILIPLQPDHLDVWGNDGAAPVSGSQCPRRPQCPQVSPDSPGSSLWCPQYPQVSRNNQQPPQPCPMLAPAVPRDTQAGVCCPSIETSRGTQLIERQSGDQQWLRIYMIYYSDARDDCVTKFSENNTNGLMVGLTRKCVKKLWQESLW